MSTPDITPAQIVSMIAALLGAIVALFGLDLSDQQQAAVLTIAGVFVPIAFMVSDAMIRRGRAKLAAANVYAKAESALVDTLRDPLQGN